MSYEMKDILKTMIDNNEPHWSADTMDMVRVEIHNVYEQATKAGEYEAKAKAWDRVYEAFEKAENEHEFSNGVCTIMNEYESGERNAKK